MIKVISSAALITAMATTSYAGSIADTQVEQEPGTVFAAAPSSGGLVLPLLIGAGALGVAVAISNNKDSTGTTAVAAAE